MSNIKLIYHHYKEKIRKNKGETVIRLIAIIERFLSKI